MSEYTSCTVHLVSLGENAGPDLPTVVSTSQCNDLPGFLLRGISCGWVHKPHDLNADVLLSTQWDFFFLTRGPKLFLGGYLTPFLEKHISIVAHISRHPAEALEERARRSGINGFPESDMPKASPRTPALPTSWQDANSGEQKHKIPGAAINERKSGGLRPGELYLDETMATYLSTAEPEAIREEPVCFFNLFKYANNDRSVHDSYMNGFKEKFGPDAGAQIKFMGPVQERLSVDGKHEESEMKWDDTNLVQYDSVWHYAHMLSTDIYQSLNQEKMRGLDDTCILMVSEAGWQRLIPKMPGEIITLK